jgi:hemoglobin/transferrin/lactoferrin receptor protein
MLPQVSLQCFLRVVFCVLINITWAVCAGAQSFVRQVKVLDAAGAPLTGAGVIVQSAQGTLLFESVTTTEGSLALSDLPNGSYQLTISASGFQPRQMSLTIAPPETAAVIVRLQPVALRSAVTVTAQRGAVEEATAAAMLVSAKEQDDFRARPLATLGNALEGLPGVLVQQSTYGQVSPFLRGLTGYQVLNLIDGVRFNNSTFRSGPNQYLAFVEPSQAQRIETLLGPAGVQYGSDALGGAINVLTETARFSREQGWGLNGEGQAFAASADAGGGGNLKFTLAAPRLAAAFGGSWRRHNDLRAGGGNDSHNVLRRFFGLADVQIRSLLGERQQDSGFTQYGWQAKLAARLDDTQNLTLWYQRGVQEGVRGYKDLWGGLGRVRSDFAPQDLHFFYARYEKLKLGFLDSLTGTFSLNAQRDGTLRQNLRTTDLITTDDNVVNAFGYAAQATTHLGNQQALTFGGEIYREAIRASRVETNPITNTSVQRRALYPSGSRYTTLGLFAQHNSEWLGNRLRASVGGRFTRVSFATFADRNRTAAGGNLGVTDEAESFQDATFNTSLTWRVTPRFNLHALVGRGFRAPNLNDLGALGLNDLGYEIPATAAAQAGALLGTSDGENALSANGKVNGLRAEKLFNYEFGATFQTRRFYGRAQVFDAELKEPIVRRTLLFPAGAAPQTLADLLVQAIAPTAEQRAQGVVTVATAIDPRAVKAFVNTGAAKYYGLETLFNYALAARWSAEGNYSFLVGRELNPNRFIRRLPPQQGFLALRYQPNWLKGRVSWLELSGAFAGAQERLSSGDLTDERIGAARRRSDIASFFRGSLVRPLIDAGADRVFGTADDVFIPTNETLLQIQNRVLPLGAAINGVTITDDNSRAPLLLKTAGYTALHLRGGIRLSERIELNWALMNLLDKNYRVHGAGVDAPGRNAFLRIRYAF